MSSRANTTRPGFNSTAKEAVSRRTPAQKRDTIAKYAETHGLTYSAAEERLLDRGLSAERSATKDILGESLPAEVTALYFGQIKDNVSAEPGRRGSPFASWDALVAAWDHWRAQTDPPHTSWWASHRIDHCASATEAIERAEAARAARVTDQTGTSWVERHKDGDNLVFWTYDDDEGSTTK